MKAAPTVQFLALVLIGLSSCQAEHKDATHAEDRAATSIPIEFLVGSYEVLGRYPDSAQHYAGTIAISLSETDPNTLSITRTIGAGSVQAVGALEVTGEGVSVLRIAFQEANQALEATYLVESDLDNYARLTGYVYLAGGGTKVPGIEVLFHDHYRAQ